MKVSLNWIKDYADINVSTRDYTEAMTMSGTKVEGYEKLGEDIQNVVVGRILSTEKHPDSDHLIICQLDVGEGKPLQIVTGAQNVKAGDLVPVCKNGALLPGGKTIKTGKLRSVLSEGMLCSLGELGLDKHDFPYAIEDGIFILEEDCKPGDDIKDVCMLDDTIVDFELTFNRPDCLAFTAIARESAAALNEKFKYTEPVCPKGDGKDDISNYLSVRVDDPTLCPRYCAKAVKNVKIAPSPLWLRARLRACGVRPINNIVDITNYVMLEYGQPMHSFDYDFIKSKSIIVRRAAENESIITLDGNEHKLDSSMLVIADGEKPIALAGVMGGENSEINDATTTVIFESANFNRQNIRRTSRTVGLRTESSRRFEKGLPPYNTMLAINRACELVRELDCGEIVDGIIDICNVSVEPTRVRFYPKRINEILGTSISREEMSELLKRIEMIVDGDEIIVPAYRNDIINTADVAEEIVRLYGVDKILPTQFECRAVEGKLTNYQAFLKKINDTCVGLGFDEIYTYSFISPKMFDKIHIPENDVRRDVIRIRNPLGDDTSVMRTTALPSILEALMHNYNHRSPVCRLFECATLYQKSESDMSYESKSLAIAFYGEGDFYDMKGYVEAILRHLGVKGWRIQSDEENPSYHPGRCAKVIIGDKKVGSFGQIHPSVASEFEIGTDVYAATLDVTKMYGSADSDKHYEPLPVFPGIERDLALVMDKDIEAQTVIDSIVRFSGKSLCSVKIFDVYTGKGVPDGKKSVAFRLTFRLPDKTMNDAEAEQAVSKILKKLKENCDIEIRS